VISGIFYGIACAMKQPPWLLAPFLLIYLYKTGETEVLHKRLRRLVDFMGPAIAVFVFVNLPFAFSNPIGWLTNIITPVSSDLVVLSQGPAVLSQVGLIQAGRLFYSTLAVAVLFVLVGNYYVYFDTLKFIFWIFPGIILWFSYRALTSYVIYWMPLMLVSLLLWYNAETAPTTATRRPR
jgi:uncharacterized membrane protein